MVLHTDRSLGKNELVRSPLHPGQPRPSCLLSVPAHGPFLAALAGAPIHDNNKNKLNQALKNQWDAEVRKSHVDGRLGATISGKLVGLGLGGGGGGLAGATGAAREAILLAAFEKAVMRLWPAFCHIDAQRRRASAAEDGEEALPNTVSSSTCGFSSRP